MATLHETSASLILGQHILSMHREIRKEQALNNHRAVEDPREARESTVPGSKASVSDLT